MDTRQVVERVVDAPAEAMFDLLTDPSRHHELDGSGTVLGLVSGERITAVGQRFRMSMDRPGRSDYRSDNIVTILEPGTTVGWATTEVDGEHLGYTWTFRLAPDGPDRTVVTHVYDWSDVVDPDLFVRFPQVSYAEMMRTVDRLAAAVA
ncbi:SRPBCC family protein [Pseudonocardia endophytica]|uniref:Polyketide cyclase/dehydrase/lipid transport protein n=1 Tax=Pseudonocardia endophytica TaxID=401976 RepID=A0A4R1I0R8_PSEEN|nr:SRPBCC family protein [Pseudonocardia endophytica]TCK26810.1 polyketide cyclase/dehydrase/lipid transport protein [Pseudonocardia endophytica]